MGKELGGEFRRDVNVRLKPSQYCNYSLILKNVMFLEKKKVVTSIGEEVEKLTHCWGECEMVQPLWNSHSGK